MYKIDIFGIHFVYQIEIRFPITWWYFFSNRIRFCMTFRIFKISRFQEISLNWRGDLWNFAISIKKSAFDGESKSDQRGSIFFLIHDFFRKLFKKIENFPKNSGDRLGFKENRLWGRVILVESYSEEVIQGDYLAVRSTTDHSIAGRTDRIGVDWIGSDRQVRPAIDGP